MQIKHTKPSETEAVITVIVDETELNPVKDIVLKKMSQNVKLPGFREGKAPLNLVEKNLDQAALQSELLEEAINQLYPQAIRSENLRPVDRPEIEIKKFVPFTTLEFEARVPIVGKVVMPDYKKMKMMKPESKVTADEVTEVLKSLQTRMAEKKEVERAAKDSDQVWIDFVGVDTKGKPIKNADGKDYPIVIGSKTFIPGFEPNLIGLKKGDEKTFDTVFPKDYGVKAMAGSKVKFTVTVKKVLEVTEPKVDDEFAKKAGPFTTVKDLKSDIKRQLQAERDQQTERDYESEIVREITNKSKIAVPKVLVDQQAERMMTELKQSAAYRGQTFPEYLEAEGKTEEQYKAEIVTPQAEERVKASLVLTEISEIENIDVTVDEVDSRIQQLKAQYKDAAMRSELDKPENRNDIASRIVTEKTLVKLKGYVSSKK